MLSKEATFIAGKCFCEVTDLGCHFTCKRRRPVGWKGPGFRNSKLEATNPQVKNILHQALMDSMQALLTIHRALDAPGKLGLEN